MLRLRMTAGSVSTERMLFIANMIREYQVKKMHFTTCQSIQLHNLYERAVYEIMEKALVNAEIIQDKIGIQVDKAKATLKIDVVDAIIDALYQAMYHFEDFGIANDKSKQVELMTSEQVKAWFENEDSGLL